MWGYREHQISTTPLLVRLSEDTVDALLTTSSAATAAGIVPRFVPVARHRSGLKAVSADCRGALRPLAQARAICTILRLARHSRALSLVFRTLLL